MVERHVANVKVAGPNPVFRSMLLYPNRQREQVESLSSVSSNLISSTKCSMKEVVDMTFI